MTPQEFARRRGRILDCSRPARWKRRALRRLEQSAEAEPVFRSGRLVGYRLPTGFWCDKIRYRTEAAALSALASCWTADLPTRRECRVYRCPLCKGWHLTSNH